MSTVRTLDVGLCRALTAAIGAAGVASLDQLLEARAKQALAAILAYLRTELRAGTCTATPTLP